MPGKKRYCYDYPRPMVTVDCVLLRVAERSLQALLIRRRSPPCQGSWALPGGFIKMNEPLPTAVIRELWEQTGLKDLSFLIQLGAYGDPGRDPRGRVVSVAFIGIVPAGSASPVPPRRGRRSATEINAPIAGSDAAAARWLAVEALPHGLAFDHATILGNAVRRLAAGGKSSGVLFAFLRDPFTPEALGDVLFAVYGVNLAPEDYLKSFLEMKLVRRLRGGRAYRFTGWHEGRRRR